MVYDTSCPPPSLLCAVKLVGRGDHGRRSPLESVPYTAMPMISIQNASMNTLGPQPSFTPNSHVCDGSRPSCSHCSLPACWFLQGTQSASP